MGHMADSYGGCSCYKGFTCGECRNWEANEKKRKKRAAKIACCEHEWEYPTTSSKTCPRCGAWVFLDKKLYTRPAVRTEFKVDENGFPAHPATTRVTISCRP
jgi:hypothetical protein